MNRCCYLLTAIMGCLCISLLARPGAAVSQGKSFTFFPATQYPLTVHFLKGEQPGPTILVQGGIQGDEPSGFLTAQILSQSKIKKGALIVVPRANVPSILAFARQINVDMNRRFDKDYNRFYEDRLARADRILLNSCSGLVHLHEGSGFYNPTYLDQIRNPKRYGQSLIIDTAVFGHQIKLAQAATQVINEINPFVLPSTYRFRLFNTNTFSPTTLYPEQRKSFTFYALSQKHIPALAIEVSKYIKDLNWKVKHQTLAAQKALKRFGVVVEPPDLPYIAPGSILAQKDKTNFQLQVNGRIYLPGQEIVLDWQSRLRLLHDKVEPSLQPVWGIFLDNCPLNLLPCQGVPKTYAHQLRLKADGQLLAQWPVRWKEPLRTKERQLICLLNNRPIIVAPGQEIMTREGDQLVILGLLGSTVPEILNLKGYVSQHGKNTGQDLGQEIILDKKSFLSAYIKQTAFGWRSEIIRETPGEKTLHFPLLVSPAICYTLQLESLTGQAISLPCQAKTRLTLKPGQYHLQGAVGNTDKARLTALLDHSPIPWGTCIYLQPGQEKRLEIYLATNLTRLASLILSTGDNRSIP